MVSEVKDKDEFETILKGNKPCVVHFWTSWSDPCKQVNDTLTELSSECSNLLFYKIEAENLAEVSLKYEVIAVPTVIFIKDGKTIGRVDGVHIPDIVKKTRTLNDDATTGGIAAAVSDIVPPKKDLNTRLKELITASPCVLFMKGNKEEPRCGFSRQMVTILSAENVQYTTFDILKDEEVRQGLKKYSNWPTYPQLYVNGELIGGIDIVKELKESGELMSTLEPSSS